MTFPAHLDYVIRYTDHRRDEQEVRLSSYEDAERLLVVMTEFWGACGPVVLDDGSYKRVCRDGVVVGKG